ncbi:MAG TPA: ABC transporter substrate-binding protein [Stellaceae bacterium]|jgi:NitT/TauT family transport system substrate-binding protein|nr:ABC transporter substrate-binding protein [Stellaceae bacterium]
MNIVKGAGIAIALSMLIIADGACAQTKLTIGTAGGGTAVAALFAAREEGLFSQRGIDATIVMGNLDPNMPPALVSHSLDIAATSATTFFQAVDGGLDLVVILGGTATSKRPNDEAVLAGIGTGIADAKDFVGRKVGVPGIGAALHVLFRYWLIERGVDFHRVDFAEASMPRMRDLLAAKTLDAAVAVNPFIDQITSAGVGYIAVPLAGQIPSGKPVIMYIATREWAAEHRRELALFREAIIDGAKFVLADPDKTREDINRYVKMPPQVIKVAPLSDQSPAIDADDLDWWFGVMKRQDMLTHDIDVKTLLVP